MPERRYSDEEVKRILASAVESDTALSAGASEQGMTLAEIQRIGSEAGLSMASVNAAAVALDQTPPVSKRVLGMPVAVAQAIALPRALDDAEWRKLVVFLRGTFEAQGREYDGPAGRGWRNGNLHITVEPAGDGAILQMRTRKGNVRAIFRIGPMLLLGAGAVEVAGALSHTTAATTPEAVMLAVGGAIVTAVGMLQLPGWGAARQKQFEAVASYARQLSAG